MSSLAPLSRIHRKGTLSSTGCSNRCTELKSTLIGKNMIQYWHTKMICEFDIWGLIPCIYNKY